MKYCLIQKSVLTVGASILLSAIGSVSISYHALAKSPDEMLVRSYQVAQADEKILTAPDLPSANRLRVETNCDRVNAGLAVTEFRWNTPTGLQDRQRIDITPFRNGFESNSFDTIGELESTRSEMVWDGGEPGINYYWRVLTRTPEGWVSSDISRYEAPTCPVDFERSSDTPK